MVIFWISWVSMNPADEKAMTTFVSVDELINDNINRRSKLGGLVTFVLKEGNTELDVKYGRTRPDLFKDGVEVIVTGQYLNGIFYADELQTKCASRYEGDLRNESSYNLNEIDS